MMTWTSERSGMASRRMVRIAHTPPRMAKIIAMMTMN
jgi:hypothetical protein